MAAKPAEKKGGATPTDEGNEEAERAIEQWKVKQLIKNLEAARGNGTSMISLIIPPKDAISRVTKMLQEEYGTASNIKSRLTRLSVLGAITSIQARLKLYTKVPPNGLVLFCGEIQTDEGKEKKVSIDFEPFKPINTSLYLCDNKFHCEALSSLLENDEKFGFIVMDGNGTLYGTLSGNTRTVLHKFTVDLPKKHGRGGQSSVRFARIRVEKRQNYVRKVAEMATQMFIQNDRPTVVGMILAGSAEFKLKLNQSDIFDPRLQALVMKIVDVSYGGENGFNQAIELASDCLANIKFIREKKLLSAYFSEIAKDSGKYCFGVKDTLTALEQGAVSDLIVYEDLQMNRYVLRNKETGAERIVHLDEHQEKVMANFKDTGSGAELEVKEKMSLLDWFSQHFKDFGAKLQFITNRSQEGAQFCKGFGGIGGLLRYNVDFSNMEVAGIDDDDTTTGDAEDNDDKWDDADFI